MPLESRDAGYLWDMLEAAQEVLGFTRGLTFEAYSRTRMLQWAVERGLQILGEAANRVSANFREAHPEIPWRKIVNQRNVLVHEYADIEALFIWDLIVEHLPRLVEQLKDLLPPLPTD